MESKRRKPGARSVPAEKRTQTLEDLVDISSSCRHPLLVGVNISLEMADRRLLYRYLENAQRVHRNLGLGEARINAILGQMAAEKAGQLLAKQLIRTMGDDA